MGLDTYLQNSKNALLIASKIDSYDKASSIIALYKLFNRNENKLDLIIINRIPTAIKTQLQNNKVVFTTEIKPQNYEMWISYAQYPIESITHDIDEKEKVVKFVIKPRNDGFSFEDVKYIEGSSNYDLTILFNIDDFKDTGSIYETHDQLFNQNPVIAFTQSKNTIGNEYIPISDGESFSEKVFDYMKKSNVMLDKEIVEALLNGTINHRRILEGNVSTNSWEVISSMASEGGDIDQSLRDLYYSKSKENLNVQIKLMQNIKMDNDKKIIWSYVTKKELEAAGVTKTSLDLTGRIQFNISKEFDLAFAVYEIEKSTLRVVVESNKLEKYEANRIAGVFGGKGTTSHSEFTIKQAKITEFDSILNKTLDELYGQIPQDASVTPK
ncbi:MAG TPA: hypothetical protein VHA12_02635 [Candidatus Nanoarchaeia archaeon]|nr:hypothetical protein [Candidatus Nanoarchaeia archaeon]